ncbi:calcium-responsive transactivator [Galendromus occidentalis]|uniref:Calcium-responsive transactivator n=1 Tax=Galendromus occidentalis TaxID=34638 RepID=A0AAJ6VZV0_9ACAR|nr:calcium-responsive transactivator [Galendromus occidentalis]
MSGTRLIKDLPERGNLVKLLDENHHLLMQITDLQNKGKVSECQIVQNHLLKNLLYLGTVANEQIKNIPPSNSIPQPRVIVQQQNPASAPTLQTQTPAAPPHLVQLASSSSTHPMVSEVSLIEAVQNPGGTIQYVAKSTPQGVVLMPIQSSQ